MSHASENTKRLALRTTVIFDLQELDTHRSGDDQVYVFRFPAGRTTQDAAFSRSAFQKIANFCALLGSNSTVCVLTTPSDAAQLQPYLENQLRFQLWVSIKSTIPQKRQAQLKEQHTALLVLTRYRGVLQHTKTRIKYSYCPACGKTTKDYGGKKHLYHEYGTLMSDVWRDIEIDPQKNIDSVVDRLSDLLGIEPYTTLQVFDLSHCTELRPVVSSKLANEQMPLFELPIVPKHTESRLINNDCLETLHSLPDNSVDFCFADPPYNLEKKYDGYNDSLELQKYFDWCDQWLSELARILKPGRTCAILNIPLWAIRHYQYLSSVLNFQAWIVWDALGFPVRMIMPSHYAIICFSKGEGRPLPGLSESERNNLENESLSPLAECFCTRSSCISSRRKNGIKDREQLSDLWHDLHRLKHNSRRVDHPTQLPPTLMRRLIALFTYPDEIVLDCFNGAGTTTLAAQQLGREYIGIELSQRYYKIALQRHNDLACGKDPFAKNRRIPSAKNSRVPRLPKQVYIVSKKTLQLDVKRIAKQIGHLPNRGEVEKLSKYRIEYFDKYFVSWGEVCAAARTTGMSELPPETEYPQSQISLYGSGMTGE